MEENKYFCPKCGTEMIADYEKPALNLTCPNCGCKIATTKWEDIDLDDTDYEVVLKPSINHSMEQIKFVSKLTGLNYIDSKKLLENGGILLKARAVELKEKMNSLVAIGINFSVTPDFPY